MLAPFTASIETISSAKLLSPVRKTEREDSVKLTSIPVGTLVCEGTVVFFGVREFQSQDCWLKTKS